MSLNHKIPQGTHFPCSNITACHGITGAFKHFDDEQISVIRKEFVLLTGAPFCAVILNQLLYWTLRVKNFNLYLEEEKAFGSNIQNHPIYPESNESSRYGWIYKAAADLSEETLLGISKTTMRKYLKVLINQGWVEERANTLEKWKKTTQYRVNIRKLHADLMNIGCHLPGVYLKAFSAVIETKQPPKHLRAVFSNNDTTILKSPVKSEKISKTENLSSESKILSSEIEVLTSKEKILPSKAKNLSLESKILSPKTEILPSYTYTENTTEITNREHTQRTRAREEKDFFEEVLGIWKTYAPQENPIYLTEERKQRLHSVFALHFQNDTQQWQQFCERVSHSPFLMGQGPRKWRASLDWILVEENLIKVLEGNFDNPEDLEQKQVTLSNAEKTKEISTILAAIKDPMWREWCSQLDFDSRDAVSLGELKSIANARFLELEGERLAWIGSSDAQVLSCIEDLRLKLLPLTQRTFPKVRNLRTRLCEAPFITQKEPPQQTGDLQ